MKVSYELVSKSTGFSQALLIIPETDFEKEFIKRHKFPTMHDGNVVVRSEEVFKFAK